MGKKKRKLEELRLVRACYTQEPPPMLSKGDCRRLKCPYADSDDAECGIQAMLDAIDLAEKLWEENKRLKKGAQE